MMRSPHLTWWHAAIAVGLLIPACNFHCNSSKVVRPKPKHEASVALNVRMLSTGQAPRVLLQVGRWTGLTYRQELTVDGSFGLMGKPAVHAPTSVTTLRFTVLQGSADPVVRHTDAGRQELVVERGVVESFGVKSPTLPPAALAVINKAYAKFVGTTMRRLVAEDGTVVEARTELVGGAKTTPRIKKLIDVAWQSERTFPFRLPNVPVGRGARWSFTEPIRVQDVHAVQVADMTVLSIGPERVTVRIRVRQSAPRQSVPNPLDPLATASLDSYRGDGEGEVTFDRLTAIALSARLATTASLTLSAPGPGGKRQSATLAAGSVLSERGQILGTGVTDAGAAAAPASDAAPGAASAPRAATSAPRAATSAP